MGTRAEGDFCPEMIAANQPAGRIQQHDQKGSVAVHRDGLQNLKRKAIAALGEDRAPISPLERKPQSPVLADAVKQRDGA